MARSLSTTDESVQAELGWGAGAAIVPPGVAFNAKRPRAGDAVAPNEREHLRDCANTR